MAHLGKYTRKACNNLFNHFERKEGIRFGNQEIDVNKSYKNYNLAIDGNQNEILKNRLSEVKVLNRADVNVICAWVVTLPKEIEKDSEEENLFFKEIYKFLENIYGQKNVISAYVHRDETTPHIHFCFIPVVLDKKKNIEKVSAKELITRKELQSFHNDLSKYMNNVFKRDIGILNGVTANGNRNILELKNESLERQNNDLLEQNNKLSKQLKLNRELIEEDSKTLNKLQTLKDELNYTGKEIDKINNKLKDYNTTLNYIKSLKIKQVPFTKNTITGVSLEDVNKLVKSAIKGLKLEGGYKESLKHIESLKNKCEDLEYENLKLKEKSKNTLNEKIKNKKIINDLQKENYMLNEILDALPYDLINLVKSELLNKKLKEQSISKRIENDFDLEL
ncbi:MobV family relaxase [Thomasclavelia spiroformis]|uniref:MobV family relaxase n=1 Tax=Thomasclavelia spiroformis TaxID=29348 RepID=UPI0024B20B69|nr:MobV family relaxase [Thomasclavelia spiroformis]